VASLTTPAGAGLLRINPFLMISTTHRTFALAIAGSVLLHVSLLGTSFVAPPAAVRTAAPQTLEVVLVNARTVKVPVKADVRAQANLDGGGNTEAPRRAKTPLPQSPKGVDEPQPAVAAAQQQVERLEAETQRVLAQIRASVPVETRDTTPTPAPAPTAQPEPPSSPVPAPSSADLASRSLEMARLRAQLSQDFDAYQERPRRKFIGSRAEEYRYARYVEDWRGKIERVGNLNYPDEARRQKLYGSLQLTVSIRRDGRVESIQINRSSGFKLLDQAAIRIVELAAPFAPFPPDISRDTDILGITRTWSFTSADQFQGQ